MGNKSNNAKRVRNDGFYEAVARASKTKVEWKGYVNIPLDEADKRHYFEWCSQGSLLEELREGVLKSGFKLSTDWQADKGAFRSSLYCQNSERAEAGYTISMWAGTAVEAELRLLYVHAVKAEFSWERWIGRKTDFEDWEKFRD